MEFSIDQLQETTRGLLPELLGIEFVSASPDEVVAELFVRQDLCTTPGVMHGGAIMAFADTLGAYGTVLNLPAGAGTTTIESKTNFFARAEGETRIRGETLPLHRGKRTLVWQTRVTRPDSRLVAVVTQTQMVLPRTPSPQEQMAGLFAAGGIDERQALLASLERAGAGIYRSFAEEETDPDMRRALHEAAEREERNAETLEEILNRRRGGS